MRVLVLGGTGFIGRAVARRLLAAGHAVSVVHRGSLEPEDLRRTGHLHTARERLSDTLDEISSFGPDAVVDVYALTRRDAEIAVECLPGLPAVVLSSQDVYAAFTGFLLGRRTWEGPLAADAPLRSSRCLYGSAPPPGVPEAYEKLDVEEVWATQSAMVPSPSGWRRARSAACSGRGRRGPT